MLDRIEWMDIGQGNASAKRLHHITLRADSLDGIAEQTRAAGGKVADAPGAFEVSGLWVAANMSVCAIRGFPRVSACLARNR